MAQFAAQQIADAFIDVYLNGLRDLRNPRLQTYYQETPRSMPSSADAEARYLAIQEAVVFDPNSVVEPASEFLGFFPVNNGLQSFVTMLTRQGLEQELIDDVEVETVDELATRNAELIDLSIQQESRGGIVSPAYMRQILANSKLTGLDVEAVNHFVEDEYPNDGYDADRKAAERARALTSYITDLLGGLS